MIRNVALLAVYVVSGVAAPIVLEYIKQQGAATAETLIYSIPNSMAMSCLLFFPQKESKILFLRKYTWQTLLMTVIDVSATTMTLFGQILCGSGIYIVIYSSLTIWSAIGSRVLMRRVFHWMQILGICVVTVGLAISGAAQFATGSLEVIVGVIITLTGTILHSCVYWLNEFFNFRFGVNMQIICGYSGLYGVCLYILYELCRVIPNYEAMVVDPVLEHKGVWWQIVLLYAALVAVDLLHMYSQYTVIPKVGSVSVGVCKSISSVAVFILSHLCFCSANKNQCIDAFKIASLVVVVSGVLTYSGGLYFQNRKRAQLASGCHDTEAQPVLHTGA